MLKVFSTLAVQGVLPGLIARFEAATGAKVATDLGPTNQLLARIKGGEAADVAILTRAGLDELATLGILEAGSIVDLAHSSVGLAVKAGARRPDIRTPEALKTALLQARSIAVSRTGASGAVFAEVVQRLGIADAVNAKATVIPSGLTGELAARGEAELAVQQISELMVVPGLDIVGPLPASLQTPTLFSAAMFVHSAQLALARAFLRVLASAEAADAYEAAGLDPVGGQTLRV
jgi:molybdate transport system substrate-binding protein